MSKFKHTGRTKDYEAAIAAMAKLPLRDRESAFAEATADDMRRAAAVRLGKPTTGQKSWRRLIGKRCAPPGDTLPADDHVELWIGKEPIYISHPYNLGLNDPPRDC